MTGELPPGFIKDAAPSAAASLPPGFVKDAAPLSGTATMSVFGTPLPQPQEAQLIQGPMTSLESLDDTMRMLASGASFGFADELSAGMNAILGIGDYETNLQVEMARDEAIREREPGAAFTAEMGGGLMTGIPGATKVMGAKAVTEGGRLMKAGAGAVTGATAGAIAGAGYAQPGERTEGAMLGAGLGAVFGGVAIPITKEAGLAIFSRFAGGKADRAAKQAAAKVAQALRRDELAPEQAVARLQELGPEARLMDVGENTRDLARAVAGQPGKAKKLAVEVLEGRQEGQGARLVDAVNKALDPTGDYAGSVSALQATRKAAAKPLYDAAYATPVEPSEALISLFRRPALARAWAKAKTIAANEGDDLPDNLFITRPDGGKVVNPDALKDVRLLDYIKRGLDDLVESKRDPVTGKIQGEVQKGIDRLRKEYLEVVDELSPAFKEARAAWSGPTRSMGLMDKGRRFVRADEEITAGELAKMTDDEKFFFRMGAARQIRDTIYKTQDGADAVKRIFGNKLTRQRLRAVFPDDATFKMFRETMMQEAELFKTRGIVSPRAGSQTQLRQEGTADLARGVADLAAGNPAGAARNFLSRLLGRNATKNLSPEQSEAIAKMLFTNSPDTNRQIIRALSFQRALEGLDIAAGVGALEAGRQSGAAITR